jgi:hypothetical protein
MTNHKYNIGDICKVVSKSPYLDGRVSRWSGDEYLGQEVRITGRYLLHNIEPAYRWDCVGEGASRGQYVLHEDSLELVKAAPQKPSWGPEYQSLIDDLREMGEEEAADYLENEAWRLCGWVGWDRISECFVFDDTPQGHTYWRDISDRLQEYRSERQKRIALRDAAADDLEKMGEVEAAENLRALPMDGRFEILDEHGLEKYPLVFFSWCSSPQGVCYWSGHSCRLQEYRSKPKPHERTKEEALKGIRKGVRVKVVSCEPLDEAGGDVWYRSEDNAATRLGEILTVGSVDSLGDVILKFKVFDPRHLEVLPYEPRKGDVVDHPEFGRGVVIEHVVSGTPLFRVYYGQCRHGVWSSTEELTYTGHNIFDLGD